jgi:hypothetical protein
MNTLKNPLKNPLKYIHMETRASYNSLKIFLSHELEQIPVPSELTNLILFYVRLLDPTLKQDLNLVFDLSDAHYLLFLRMELSKKLHDMDEMADLMLTVFSKQKIVSEIIGYVYGLEHKFYEKQITLSNIFLDPISSNHVDPFRKALFDAALKTNRVAALKLLYPNISNMHLGELLCHFFEKFGFEADIHPIAFDGDMITIAYIFENCQCYRNMIKDLSSFPSIFAGALHSGNLEFVNWLFAKQYSYAFPISVYPKLFKCLLRCNRLEQAKSLLNGTECDKILNGLTMSIIFYTDYDSYFPAMPKVNLETYEFCLQILGIEEVKERIEERIEEKIKKGPIIDPNFNILYAPWTKDLLSDAILIKYSKRIVWCNIAIPDRFR